MNIIALGNLKCAGSFAIIFRTLFDVYFSIVAKCILNCLHYVYKLFLLVESRRGWLRERDVEIAEEVLLLKKVPHHLLLVLNREDPPYRDLVHIIVWSIAAGISHLSFYHHYDCIDSKVLFDHVCKHAIHHIPAIKWGKSFPEHIKLLSKNRINGYRWSPTVTVHLHQRADWENQLLSTISNLHSNHCHRVDVQSLDSELRIGFRAPDPELCLVAANVVSFFGFPPWFLRITQIQEVTFHSGITLQSFLDSLRKYSNCEQRYGK